MKKCLTCNQKVGEKKKEFYYGITKFNSPNVDDDNWETEKDHEFWACHGCFEGKDKLRDRLNNNKEKEIVEIYAYIDKDDGKGIGHQQLYKQGKCSKCNEYKEANCQCQISRKKCQECGQGIGYKEGIGSGGYHQVYQQENNQWKEKLRVCENCYKKNRKQHTISNQKVDFINELSYGSANMVIWDGTQDSYYKCLACGNTDNGLIGETEKCGECDSKNIEFSNNSPAERERERERANLLNWEMRYRV